MISRFAGLLGLSLLVGCSGSGSNPVTGGNIIGGTGVGTDTAAGADGSAGAVYATDLNEDLTANSISFDATNDQLIVNNIPFDGPTGEYTRRAGVGFGTTGAQAYESAAGARQYYAIFQQTASGNAQTTAIGTDSYISFGFGGGTAQRINSSITLPGVGEFTYTGTYAAVRTTLVGGVGPGDVSFVTADATVEVDILDFDTTGAVEASTGARTIYDLDGNVIDTIGGIALATTGIDFDNATILEGSASGFELDPATGILEPIQTGTYTGVFAGANANEVALLISLEGTGGFATPEDSVRETGGIIAVDPTR